jgi:hypothetical protein
LNQQEVPIDRIEDHLEVLPSTEVERATVSFPTSDSAPATDLPLEAPAEPLAEAQAAEPAVPVIAQAAPSSVELKKIQQEEARAAFRSRLAGIKNTVNSLNSRLADIEVDANSSKSPKVEDAISLEDLEADEDDQDDDEGFL